MRKEVHIDAHPPEFSIVSIRGGVRPQVAAPGAVLNRKKIPVEVYLCICFPAMKIRLSARLYQADQIGAKPDASGQILMAHRVHANRIRRGCISARLSGYTSKPNQQYDGD